MAWSKKYIATKNNDFPISFCIGCFPGNFPNSEFNKVYMHEIKYFLLPYHVTNDVTKYLTLHADVFCRVFEFFRTFIFQSTLELMITLVLFIGLDERTWRNRQSLNCFFYFGLS